MAGSMKDIKLRIKSVESTMSANPTCAGSLTRDIRMR